MNINSLSNTFQNNVQSLLSASLRGTGLTTSSGGTSASGITGQQPDSTQLSPLAQLLSTLQHIQQSNPAKYRQVTQQIATNLQSAAQTAKQNGNTIQANQLSQLASDFTDASTRGQMPNVKDLAAAIAGGHHHHHGSSGDPNSSSTSTATNQTLQQALAAFQSANIGATQTQAQNPLAIILNTISSAGITNSSS